jgi:hypothetical protein
MDDERDPKAEEERILAEYNDRFRSALYRQVFYPPPGAKWKVDASFPQSFFESAKLLLTGIVEGTLREGIEGIPAVFLARHYLELALKYALFHSRWLTDQEHNAIDVAPVERGHKLLNLWDTLLHELRSKRISLPDGLDLLFVAQFVRDFQRHDPNNWRFRYPSRQIAVASPGELTHGVGIDFPALLFNLKRAHDILETLDSYLVDTYGENEDWEDEQNSW